MTYRLTPEAEADPVAIGDDIGADDRRAAARFLARLEEKFALLNEVPMLGPAREDIAPWFPVSARRPIHNSVLHS